MKFRKQSLPESVRDQLKLRPRERILAWADDGSGRAVVASETALHLQRVPPRYSRFGWEQIERVGYEAGVLTITLTPELDSATLRVPVGEDRHLPVVIRDRVTASVLVDRHVALLGDDGVRIVGKGIGDRGDAVTPFLECLWSQAGPVRNLADDAEGILAPV